MVKHVPLLQIFTLTQTLQPFTTVHSSPAPVRSESKWDGGERMTQVAHEVKKTTRKPTQLPTTPTAEYELMNINGKNSYLAPKTS